MRRFALAALATLAAGPALAQPYYGGPYGYAYAPPPPPPFYGTYRRGPYDGSPYGHPYGGYAYGYYRPAPRAFPNDPNNTGGGLNIVVPRGGLGADTYQSNSAVAGNQSRPELAVPNGSGGGSTR